MTRLILLITWSILMATAPIEARAAALIGGYWERTAADANAALARAVRDLAANPEASSPRWRALRAARVAEEIARLVERTGGESRAALLASLAQTSREGRQLAGAQLRQLGTERVERALDLGPGTIKDAGPRLEDVRAVALDSAARLEEAAGDHAARAQRVFRSFSDGPLSGVAKETAVNEAIVRGLTSGDPRVAERAIRAQIGDLTDEQIEITAEYRRVGRQIIEVGNAQMSVRAYAEMVTRTRMREATESGSRAQQQEYGIELVVIDGANSRNFCTRYLGLVCALTREATDGGRYPLLSSLPGQDGARARGAGGPPWHPNCTKSTSPWVEGVMPDELEEQARRSATNYQRDVSAGRLGSDIGARERR